MKFLAIITCFSFTALTAQAQSLSFQGTIGMKKDIVYNRSQFVNTDNIYRFVSHPNPYFEVDAIYDLRKIDLLAGLSLYRTKYWIHYDYHTQSADFKQQFGLRITNIQLPVRIEYKITDKLKIGLGLALNYHSFNLNSYEDSFYGTDSFDIEWDALNPKFSDYFSLSNQLVASFEPYKHWMINFIADIDWRSYPFVRLNDIVTKEQKVIQNTLFSGSPKMIYLALGISYRI